MTDPSQTCDSPTAARRKREIAEAARAELMEKGVEGLRMRAVADRAGINIATLDYHVGGKERLIELVAQSIADDFKDQHLRNLRADATAIERLVQELINFREVRVRRPDIPVVMATLTRRAPTDAGIAKHINPMRLRWHNLICDTFALGAVDGTLRAGIDPPAAARVFKWAMLGMNDPDILRLSYPEHAAELLRAFAHDPTIDFERYFT